MPAPMMASHFIEFAELLDQCNKCKLQALASVNNHREDIHRILE